jgi:hypothetical protein
MSRPLPQFIISARPTEFLQYKEYSVAFFVPQPEDLANEVYGG